jgi:hypothetical protein
MCFMLYGYRLVVGWFTHVDRFTGFSGCLSLAQKDFRFSQFADDLYSGKVLSWHGFLSPCPDPNIKVGSAFGSGQHPADAQDVGLSESTGLEIS